MQESNGCGGKNRGFGGSSQPLAEMARAEYTLLQNKGALWANLPRPPKRTPQRNETHPASVLSG